MPSIETPDENSTSAIQSREKQTFADYFETTLPQNQQFATMSPLEFDKLHINYPNDAFEVVIEKTVLGHIFQIICHDCDGRRVATKFQGSIAKLRIHLNAESHVSNVMSKLDRMGDLPIETLETKKRMEVLRRIASQRGHDHHKPTHRPNYAVSVGKDLSARSSARRSTSPRSMEILQAMYELPPEAFIYKPPQPEIQNAFADQSSSSVHEPTPPVQKAPSHPTLPYTDSLKAPETSFRRDVYQRFEGLDDSNRKKKMKLDHYGTLLEQTNNKYEELERQLSTLKSREDQHAAYVQSMRDSVISGIDNISQMFALSQAVPPEFSEQLDALLSRDEQHESRWEELENYRADLPRLLHALSQKQDRLEDKLSSLLIRERSTETSADVVNIDARIRELESSKIQLLESHNELEQENQAMNARFVLLERHDNSLDEARLLITDISDRIKTLENARDHSLPANEGFAQSLKKLSKRVEVAEQNSLSMTTQVKSVRESIGQLDESIDLLNDRFSAQDKHIENLTKKVKKFDEWVKYFSNVIEIQKTCIEDMQNKQITEAKSRRSFEQRIEEILKGSQEREEKMAERIKTLEKKEERSATQLAMAKTFATPRSEVGSDNERGGSSTPKSSSQMGAASTTSRTLQLTTGNGITTPIRPPSRTSLATSTSRTPSTSTLTSTAIRPPSQKMSAATPILPPQFSQTVTNGSKNVSASQLSQPADPPKSSRLPSSSQPPKSSQPLVPNRKPRKF